MALKKYDVEINGHETTLLLNDEDAERMGLRSKPAKAAAPAKARTPANKAAVAEKNK